MKNIVNEFLEVDLEKIFNQFERVTKVQFSQYMWGIILLFIGLSRLSSKIMLLNFSSFIYLFWFSLFLISVIIKITNLNPSKITKIYMVVISFIIGIGAFWNKQSFIKYIGESYIKGYHIEYSESYGEDKDDIIIHSYNKADNWTGELILDSFSFLFYPAILLIIFFTWKFLQKKNREN